MNPKDYMLEPLDIKELPNYFEYTALKLLSKEYQNIIHSLRDGIGDEGGINYVLNAYAEHAENSKIKDMNTGDIDSIPNGKIVKIQGFYSFAHENNYYLYKRTIRKDLTKESKKEIEKFVKQFAFEHIVNNNEKGDEIAMSEEEKGISNRFSILKKSGLTQYKPFNKIDFIDFSYREIKKEGIGGAFAEDFGEKFTKKALGIIPLNDILSFFKKHKVENIITQAFSGGYTLGEDRKTFQRKRGLLFEDIVLNHAKDIRGTYKNIINNGIEVVRELKEKLTHFANMGDEERKATLAGLSEKETIKEVLSDNVEVIDTYIERVFEPYSAYLNDNGSFEYFSESLSAEIDTIDDLPINLQKLSLVNSYSINRKHKEDPSVFDTLKLEVREIKTIYDYGYKKNVDDLLLYIESLKDIQSKEKIKDFNVGNGKENTQGFGI